MTIIIGLFSLLFGRWLGPRRGAIASGIGILFYTLLVGASASVVRAAIMGSIGLLGRQLGRRQDGLNSLSFTGALMALLNPMVLWDVGFQLSFAATLGLVLYAGQFTAAFERLAARWLPAAWLGKVVGWVGDYLLMTLAAQLLTLPIMAYYFNSVSLVGQISNPVLLLLGLPETALKTSPERSTTVLLWPNHLPADPAAYLAAAQPRLVIAGAAVQSSKFGSAEVQSLFQPYTLLRTDINGWIRVSTDGGQMWVEVERR